LAFWPREAARWRSCPAAPRCAASGVAPSPSLTPTAAAASSPRRRRRRPCRRPPTASIPACRTGRSQRDLVRFGLRTSRRELVTITMVTVLGGLLDWPRGRYRHPVRQHHSHQCYRRAPSDRGGAAGRRDRRSGVRVRAQLCRAAPLHHTNARLEPQLGSSAAASGGFLRGRRRQRTWRYAPMR